MKRKIVFVIIAFCFTFLNSCIFKTTSYPQKEYVTVEYQFLSDKYLSEENGSLGGNSRDNAVIIEGGDVVQTIEKGSDTQAITVKPKIGYKFLYWWDNKSSDSSRTEFNVNQNIVVYAIIGGPYYQDFYFHAGEGGTLQGVTVQKDIPYMGDGQTVTAVADNGYRFVKWSDGQTEPVRTNENVQCYGQPLDVYAEFERYERKYQYVYNGATSGDDKKEVSINLDNLSNLTLPTPTRENFKFEGWYSDWFHLTKISDQNGKIIVGKEWLQNEYLYNKVNPEGYLYAKWSPLTSVPKYKVLMVFITNVDTYLKTIDKEMIRVCYKMTNYEKRICDELTVQMENYLNAIFNATVEFEVDSYYVQDILDDGEYFNCGVASDLNGNLKYNYTVGSMFNGKKDLPEIREMRKMYDSVITSFCMNDYDGYLIDGFGSGHAKYASIHLESLFSVNHFADLFDYTKVGVYDYWTANLESYIYTFTFTVEGQVGILGRVSNVAKYYYENNGDQGSSFLYLNDYLTNNFYMNDEMVGIPFDFWSNPDQYWEDNE